MTARPLVPLTSNDRGRRGLLACLVVAAGCAGPEPRTPERDGLAPRGGSQPTVTRPDAPPESAAPPAEVALGLDAFAAVIAAAWREDPGPVAVLPAFSDDPLQPRGTQVFATAAGDWVAARLVSVLEASGAGVEAWGPETVVVELARRNRSLRDVRAADDAVALVQRTDAGYLVHGDLEVVSIGGRLSGQRVVRIRLACTRLATGQTVAMRSATLEHPAHVRDLAARAEHTSSTLVGLRAPPFEPSLDLEASIAAELALRRLLAAHRAVLAGKRCAVVFDGAASPAGAKLAATVRASLQARLARALPGRDAITVVEEPRAADVVLRASLSGGADRHTLVLAAGSGAVAQAVLDPRFHAALGRMLP